MNIIIGGVERQISQVATYMQYQGGSDNIKGKTVRQILDESRADRLLEKEKQKRFIKESKMLIGGSDKIIEVIDVNYPSDKILNKTDSAFQIATEIEKNYAQQAKMMSEYIF